MGSKHGSAEDDSVRPSGSKTMRRKFGDPGLASPREAGLLLRRRNAGTGLSIATRVVRWGKRRRGERAAVLPLAKNQTDSSGGTVQASSRRSKQTEWQMRGRSMTSGRNCWPRSNPLRAVSIREVDPSWRESEDSKPQVCGVAPRTSLLAHEIRCFDATLPSRTSLLARVSNLRRDARVVDQGFALDSRKILFEVSVQTW